MIQFNLLPDVKLQYIKARRTKRLVILGSMGLSALSIFVLLLSLITVDVVQKKSLHDLDRDITTNNSKLKSIPNIDKILTVQNQLNTLTGLHDKKPVTSRFFTFISQLTPNDVTLNNTKIDYTANTIELSGSSASLDLVNQFVDTLKSTTYALYTPDTAGQQQEASDQAYFKDHNSYPTNGKNGTAKAFSNVVLSSFGKTNSSATYTIDLGFDPLIFSNTNIVDLHVPVGTISNTSILFKNVGS